MSGGVPQSLAVFVAQGGNVFSGGRMPVRTRASLRNVKRESVSEIKSFDFSDTGGGSAVLTSDKFVLLGDSHRVV